MSVLVTGGAGYIGSVTVNCLLARGTSVVVLDDLYRGHRSNLKSSVPFYQGRVGDRNLVATIVREHGVESCLHFAALAYVEESVREPRRYFENNVEQGIVLIGTLLAENVKRIVFSSTCATYGDVLTMPIREDAPQWPKNPYGWSKLMMEQILSAYDASDDLRYVALRYFNAAGATDVLGECHDPEPHLIPRVLLTALGTSNGLTVFGQDYPTADGTAVRDYVHVADLADAHILALDYLQRGGDSGSFNLGTGQGHSVLQVIEAARIVTGCELPYLTRERRAGDAATLVADSGKAKAVLGWKPQYSDLSTILKSQWESMRRSTDHGRTQ
jgi:UDP-glucose 4-epimerase